MKFILVTVLFLASVQTSFAMGACSSGCSQNSCTIGGHAYINCSASRQNDGTLVDCGGGNQCLIAGNSNSQNNKQASQGAINAYKITDENKNKDYGGAYGGSSVSTTGAVNEAVKLTTGAVSQLGTTMTNNAGAVAQSNISTTGTAQSVAQGTADTLNANAKAQTTAGMTNLAASMTEMYRAYSHQASVSKVGKTADTGYSAIKAKRTTCNGDANKLLGDAQTAAIAKCTAQYTEDEANVDINKNNEQATQKQAAVTEAITASGNGMAAVNNFQQAAAAKKAAAAALASAGSGFAFNPGGTEGYTDTGAATTATPDPGSVLNSDAANSPLDASNQINPNVDPGTGNVPTGGLVSANPAAAPAGGGGGLGSASGTSAGKDDASNKDTTPPGKNSAGSYSAGDGPSGFSRNAAGGPAVGLDGSFADMLKKFLPGDEEKKKDGDINFNDRTPASDAAAVIARNKNIFEEISKRYKKKSSEGAIVF